MNPANWSWRVRGAGYIVMLAGLGCLATGCEAGRFDGIERVYPTDLDGDQTDELVVFHDASGETGLESLGLEWLEPTGGRLSGFELSGGYIRWTGAIREVGYGSVQKGTWRRDQKLVFAANHPGPRIVEYDLETREAGWREHFDNHGDSPPSTGYWGHADGETLVAGVQTAPRELALRGVELDSGKERWEHRLEVKPVRPTLRGSQFTGSRFVARVSSPDRSIVAVGLESGELVRLSGTSGPYLSDDRALFVRRPEEGSTSKRLYQLRDGEEKARPVERDGRQVEFRGRVAGVDDGRLIVLHRRDERLSGQRYDTIVGIPFKTKAERFEHQFDEGMYYDPTFVDGWETDALSAPFTRTKGRYSSIPLKTSPVGKDARHRIAVVDLEAGEMIWRSESFARAETDEVVDYQVVSEDGSQIVVFDNWPENEGSRQVAMSLDTGTGEIRGAAGFGDVDLSRWSNERAVSDGGWYGAADGTPWALELDGMELRYGPTVEWTDATDELIERFGQLPAGR